MVQMSVGNNYAANAPFIFFQPFGVRNNIVNAGHGVVRKGKAHVNHNQVIAVFQHGHVFSDLFHASHRDDPQVLPGCGVAAGGEAGGFVNQRFQPVFGFFGAVRVGFCCMAHSAVAVWPVVAVARTLVPMVCFLYHSLLASLKKASRLDYLSKQI